MPVMERSIPVRVEGHVTYEQAATILGRKIDTVKRLVAQGKLQRYHLEGFAYVHLLGESEVIAYRETMLTKDD